jgi:hypothetical protein
MKLLAGYTSDHVSRPGVVVEQEEPLGDYKTDHE